MGVVGSIWMATFLSFWSGVSCLSIGMIVMELLVIVSIRVGMIVMVVVTAAAAVAHGWMGYWAWMGDAVWGGCAYVSSVVEWAAVGMRFWS